MNKLKRVGMALLGAALLTLGLATVSARAQAHHNGVSVTFAGSACEGLTFTTGWDGEDHKVANTVLVVKVNGKIRTAPVGEPLTVGPFDKFTKVYYRIWGGGERDYDNPVLADLTVLLKYLDVGGNPLDSKAPGVAWYKTYLKGCPEPTPTMEPTPTATSEPTPTPTEEPTSEPTEGPTAEPTPTETTSAPLVPAGNEKPGLPVTGASLPVLIGAGVILVGAGAGALLLFRKPKSTLGASPIE